MPRQETKVIEQLSTWLGTGRRAWALALLFALLQGGLLVHTAWDKSETTDEPFYLAMALKQWGGQGGELNYEPVVPPWGFALYGRMSWASYMATALVINVAMVLWANWWLSRYSIAPVEWAWRSVVERRRLPFRLGPDERRGGGATVPA